MLKMNKLETLILNTLTKYYKDNNIIFIVLNTSNYKTICTLSNSFSFKVIEDDLIAINTSSIPKWSYCYQDKLPGVINNFLGKEVM